MEAGPTNVPRRNLPATVAIVGACAALLIALAGAFYIAGSRHVYADLERTFIAASACVVAIPWLTIAIAIARRRLAAALLMAMMAAAAFLLCVGWLAILLFILSWDKGALELIPLVMTGVHLVALFVAIIGWRGLAPEERAMRSRVGVALLPVGSGLAMAAIAGALWMAADRQPRERVVNDAAMEQLFRRFAACLSQQTGSSGAAPQRATDLRGDCAAPAREVASQPNYSMEYLREDFDVGDASHYFLCLRPK